MHSHRTAVPSDEASTRIGIDLVEVAAIERSMAEFGDRFARRLFAPDELRASMRGGRLDPEALAVRFAAKEAAIKAFDLSEAGVGWSQIEVLGVPDASGVARLALSGRAAQCVAALGPVQVAATVACCGGLAGATVVAMRAAPPGRQPHPTEGALKP